MSRDAYVEGSGLQWLEPQARKAQGLGIQDPVSIVPGLHPCYNLNRGLVASDAVSPHSQTRAYCSLNRQLIAADAISPYTRARRHTNIALRQAFPFGLTKQSCSHHEGAGPHTLQLEQRAYRRH